MRNRILALDLAVKNVVAARRRRYNAAMASLFNRGAALLFRLTSFSAYERYIGAAVPFMAGLRHGIKIGAHSLNISPPIFMKHDQATAKS